MKKPIPYILALLVGLFSRTAISALNGWEYSMNGIDLLCGLTCIVMVWSFKGAFLPKGKKTPLNGNSASGKRKIDYSGILPQKKGICQDGKNN